MNVLSALEPVLVPPLGDEPFRKVNSLLKIPDLVPHAVKLFQHGILALLKKPDAILSPSHSPAPNPVRDGPPDGRHSHQERRPAAENKKNRECAFEIH